MTDGEKPLDKLGIISYDGSMENLETEDTNIDYNERARRLDAQIAELLRLGAFEDRKGAADIEAEQQRFADIITAIEGRITGSETAQDLRHKAAVQAGYLDELFLYHFGRAKENPSSFQELERALKMQQHALRAMHAWCRLDARLNAGNPKHAERTEQNLTQDGL